LGFTFKEDVSDIRNTKVADIVRELKDYGLSVDLVDPMADPDQVRQEYGFEMKATPAGQYDLIVLAVAHEQYRALSLEDLKALGVADTFLVDVKGLFATRRHQLGWPYWSL
jgi:UDP-N-acetyl-D-galactosamine dehydrogenase